MRTHKDIPQKEQEGKHNSPAGEKTPSHTRRDFFFIKIKSEAKSWSQLVPTQMKGVAHAGGECPTWRWDGSTAAHRGSRQGGMLGRYKDAHRPLDTSPYQYYVSGD